MKPVVQLSDSELEAADLSSSDSSFVYASASFAISHLAVWLGSEPRVDGERPVVSGCFSNPIAC